ncbi:acyl-CoA thioesterase II [Pseudomonas capeferrum]|uniref:acyl-CoA thioesterase n=1 Tax=Pseudomonas capeferrum TaxID=1495066 RepID=UPI0015E3ABA3|nr:acyl-CoA thioesterase domain-containing protein [Pseudomonas capeferrum]MBA1204813.1 acyl-CoA thioesterase II [Pseudomonas capeferrum]
MNGNWSWDQRDLTELLSLEKAADNTWRSYVCDTNANGRVYAGQLLGQALWAAAQTVEERSLTMLQMTFLQGARPQESIEYSVETLQDGRRISSRHIYGVQGAGLVMSANASFQAPAADSDDTYRLARQVPGPESLATLSELAAGFPAQGESLQLRARAKPLLDIRLINPAACFDPAAGPGEVAYWMRLDQPLPSEGCLHHAALAYMSDSWLSSNVSSRELLDAPWQHYVSNLNHSLWFHCLELDVTQWLLFVDDGVRSMSGRSLAMANIFRRDGRLVASVARDLLISPRAT